MEEVLHVALTARYYAVTASVLHDRRGRGLFPVLTRIDRHYQPKGLVGVIAPWNYPLTMAISDGLAALVAGNAILLKPDPQTPFVPWPPSICSASAACRTICGRSSTAPGDQVGPALISQVDYVCFTGSTRDRAGSSPGSAPSG